MDTKTFLVIGATGTQGSSVVQALLNQHNPDADPPIKILALTRNTTSAKAQFLARDPRVQLLQGDPTSPKEIFTTASTPITGVFCVTVHGPPGAEETQAQGLIDASIANDVDHFVFTSADRGGEVYSDTHETPVPHIATKHRIEQYLKKRTADSPMTWTILRPVTFMDNLTPDFQGKGFAAMWRGVGYKPIQLVAANDIGFFAAKALLAPTLFAQRHIGIAGDELNYSDAVKIFKQTMGADMPTTFCAVGSVLKLALGDVGAMFKWFERDGFNVDIDAAREMYPDLQDFRTWLIRNSGFAMQNGMKQKGSKLTRRHTDSSRSIARVTQIKSL